MAAPTDETLVPSVAPALSDMPRRSVSLCTGIQGLDVAAEQHFGARTVAYSEIEKALVPWLAESMPGVPNLGDLKLIDWAAVASALGPIHVVTAGYPCQPFSHAGKREGTDDPRHLYPYIADAVRHLRPRYVVLENVRGHLSLGFDVVLGSLAEAGFDAEWCVLRASDVGACHQRARLFIVARNTDSAPEDAHSEAGSPRAAARQPDRHAPDVDGGRREEQPQRDGGSDPWGQSPRGDDPERLGVAEALTLLPTPVVNDMGANKTPEQWDAWTAEMQQRHGNGNGHGKSLSIEAQRLPMLPTPKASDADRGGDPERWRGTKSLNGRRSNLVDAAMHFPAPVDWGIYEPAIRRHEEMLGRYAPLPKLDNKLSPHFVEWMQGYPEGWVADHLLRTHALKALGNSVVPQQALAALDELCPGARLIGAAA